jgi:hypothetical protein
MKAVLSLIGLSAIAFGAGSAGPLLAQNQTAGAAADRSPAAAARTWTPRRLPDGQPDIQGVWTNYDSTPFETFDANDTPHIYAGNPSGKSTGPNAFPMDAAGRKLAKRRSLVVDPPSGRVPVQKWAEDKRDYDLARVNDSWVHQTAWERCITRGVPGGMFPAAYNAGYRILQAPGYVVILYEMIHEARVIPIDGRPHASPKVRLWNGDSRGRWEGDTLVVEVTNYNDRGNIATNIATQRIRALPQSEAAPGRRALHAGRRRHDRVRGHDRRPEGLPCAVEGGAPPDARGEARALRVRVPRGQSRHGEPAERRTRGRAGSR